MRSKALAFIVAFACAVLPPAVSSAIPAPKREEAAASSGGSSRLPRMTAATQTKGMGVAQGYITGAGVPCTLTGANYIIDANEKIDGKTVKTSYVEVACQEGLGYTIGSRAGGGYVVNDCLVEKSRDQEKARNPLLCQLPANATPWKGLTPGLQRANFPCDPTNGKVLGMTATGSVVYEVVCASGGGARFIADTPRSATSAVRAQSCYELIGTQQPCTLVTEEQAKAPITALAAKSEIPCQVKDQRSVGANSAGARFYEFACTSGQGVIIQANASGAYEKTIPCFQAGGLGGCKLSDSKVEKTDDNALYTRLAKAAGFDCTVSKYGSYPPQLAPQGTEVIELACANRPDSAVGIFGATNQILNCTQAEAEGFPCSYSPKEAAYTKLTADLKSYRPDSTCNVSQSRAMAKSNTETFVEVKCDDGGGLVVVYPKGVAKPSQMLSCGQASSVAGGCKLGRPA